MDDKLKKALQTLDGYDAHTLIACLFYCATLDKKARKTFQIEYGMKADKNITALIEKHNKRT